MTLPPERLEAERVETYEHIVPNMLTLLEQHEDLFLKLLKGADRDSQVSARMIHRVHKILYGYFAPHFESRPEYRAVYDFYCRIIADMIYMVRTEQPMSLLKVLALVAVVCPDVDIPTLMVFQRALPSYSVTARQELAKYRETFQLFIEVLRLRKEVPEVQHELLEIKRLSIDYLLQNTHGNLSPELMEEILACLFLSRLYNITYWYIYGKH